jgi:hypothetical protein
MNNLLIFKFKLGLLRSFFSLVITKAHSLKNILTSLVCLLKYILNIQQNQVEC